MNLLTLIESEPERKCSLCLSVKPAVAFSWRAKQMKRYKRCKECVRKQQRESYPLRQEKVLKQSKARYQKNPEPYKRHAKEYSLRNPEKMSARLSVSNAVMAGKLEKFPCGVCGEKKTDGHHFDYSEPLVVVWLCRRHHAWVHKKVRNKQRELLRAEQYAVIEAVWEIAEGMKRNEHTAGAQGPVIAHVTRSYNKALSDFLLALPEINKET